MSADVGLRIGVEVRVAISCLLYHSMYCVVLVYTVRQYEFVLYEYETI